MTLNGQNYRIEELIEYLGIGKTTIYNMIKKGDFPKPFRISPGLVRWHKEDIDKWLESRRRHA